MSKILKSDANKVIISVVAFVLGNLIMGLFKPKQNA